MHTTKFNKLRTFQENNPMLFGGLLILTILAIAFTSIHIQNSITDKRLLANAAITVGYFNGDIEQYRKGSNGPSYVCRYVVNNRTFYSYEPVKLCRKLIPRIFKQPFPVLYDSTNPEHGRVLVFPFEFDEFQINFPDSLKWVKLSD